MLAIILVISSIPILILINYTLWTANVMCLYKHFRLLNEIFAYVLILYLLNPHRINQVNIL